MPVVTKQEIQGYAHCIANGCHCPGYAQEEVPAVREETGFYFTDNGGDIPNAIERSTYRVLFANEEDRACPQPGCGEPREITDQARKVYKEQVPGSILPPMPTPAPADADEVARMRAELDQLKAELGVNSTKPKGKS